MSWKLPKEYVGSILYYIAVLYTLQYLYAFSMSPMASVDPKELTQQPPAATNCPFAEVASEKV